MSFTHYHSQIESTFYNNIKELVLNINEFKYLSKPSYTIDLTSSINFLHWKLELLNDDYQLILSITKSNIIQTDDNTFILPIYIGLKGNKAVISERYINIHLESKIKFEDQIEKILWIIERDITSNVVSGASKDKLTEEFELVLNLLFEGIL